MIMKHCRSILSTHLRINCSVSICTHLKMIAPDARPKIEGVKGCVWPEEGVTIYLDKWTHGAGGRPKVHRKVCPADLGPRTSFLSFCHCLLETAAHFGWHLSTDEDDEVSFFPRCSATAPLALGRLWPSWCEGAGSQCVWSYAPRRYWPVRGWYRVFAILPLSWLPKVNSALRHERL